jgi:hypothetical protein
VDWIHLAQNRDPWWLLVNIVINLWVPQKVGYFLTKQLLASKGLCSMELLSHFSHACYMCCCNI